MILMQIVGRSGKRLGLFLVDYVGVNSKFARRPRLIGLTRRPSLTVRHQLRGTVPVGVVVASVLALIAVTVVCATSVPVDASAPTSSAAQPPISGCLGNRNSGHKQHSNGNNQSSANRPIHFFFLFFKTAKRASATATITSAN